MRRDASTPLILWVCAAVCAHYMFAQGGGEVARIHDDGTAIAKLARGVRERVRASEQTFEVVATEVGEEPNQADPPNAPTPPKEKEKEKAKEEKPEEKPKAAEPPKEEKKIPAVAKVEEKKPEPPPPLMPDKRIAVRQHAKPDQADNEKANFVGDQANHVEEETVARQTSHDQDDPNPTPGGNHSSSDPSPGDSDRTKIAESEEQKGEKNRAPGDKGTTFELDHGPPKNPAAVAMQTQPAAPKTGGDGRPTSPSANTPAPPELTPGGSGPAAPDTTQSPSGGWSFNPVRPGMGLGAANDNGPGSSSDPAHTKKAAPTTAWLGLGGTPGPGRVNLNLSHEGVVAIVGDEQIRKMREADGERRKSEHRGSWKASSLERWRSAIENYVSTVKPGNQTALNTASVPFGTYLNGMHNRIHPIFADNFLGSLASLPPTHALNDPRLVTHLEIVLTKDGHLVKMGVVKTSGNTVFDVAALDSVQRASPFGSAPGAIVSTDGNVYLHWEFHRDEVYACSTMNARPFLLNLPPKGPPTETPTPPGQPPFGPSRERGSPENTGETRHGKLDLPGRRSL
ncbi:MAG: TonB C-terminal domain-containing protein [Polyangiaceae bacterium]